MKRKGHAHKRVRERLGMNSRRSKTKRTINRDIRNSLSRGSVMIDTTGVYIIFGSIGTYIVTPAAVIVTVMRPICNTMIDSRFLRKIPKLVPVKDGEKVLSKFYTQ